MSAPFPVPSSWPLLVADLGVSEVRLLKRAGLPVDLFRRAVRAHGEGTDVPRITAQQYFGVFDALVEELDDPLLGLRLGQSFSVEMFEPPVFAALCSPDMARAVERLGRFKRLVGPFRLGVEPTESDTTLTYDALGVPAMPTGLGQMELVFITHLLRLATRSPVKPLEVSFCGHCDPELVSEYERFFGCPVRTGREEWAVRFSDLDMRRPFLTANSGMWDVFEPGLRRRLAELDATADTTERVRASLFELLPSGRSSVADVGRMLGMSRRSLQRRLAGENTTFQAVLDQTREDLARHYLGQTALSSAEIGFLLGYDDPSSFFRAFQRWTGETPETVRAQLRERSAER